MLLVIVPLTLEYHLDRKRAEAAPGNLQFKSFRMEIQVKLLGIVLLCSRHDELEVCVKIILVLRLDSVLSTPKTVAPWLVTGG